MQRGWEYPAPATRLRLLPRLQKFGYRQLFFRLSMKKCDSIGVATGDERDRKSDEKTDDDVMGRQSRAAPLRRMVLACSLHVYVPHQVPMTDHREIQADSYRTLVQSGR